jgi:hypothetical protein
VQRFQELAVTGDWQPLCFRVQLGENVRVHEGYIHQPQKQRFIVLTKHERELHGVALQPELIVDINATHPALIVHDTARAFDWQLLSSAQASSYIVQ